MQVVPEPVDSWQDYPCLDKSGQIRSENVLQRFYDNPARFAYSFQHYVLLSRLQKVSEGEGVCGGGLAGVG